MRFNLFIFAAAALFMAACGGGGAKGDGPKEVASNFIKHVNNMEFDEAKKYSTEGTAGILDMLKSFAGMAEKPESTAFEILDVKEEGDKATVTYRNEGADADETITLVKENGKWLVDINKEDMNKEDGDDDLGSLDFDGLIDDLGEEIEEAGEELEEIIE